MIHQLEMSPVLRRWLASAVVLLIAVSLWTISASSSDAATTTVEMKDFAFQPAEVTVSVGDTVTWVNKDADSHAVQGGPMSSPIVPTNGTFSHTFSEAGDVPYICPIHTYMTGTIHVTDGSTTTSTTEAPTSTTAPGGSTTTTAPGGSTTTTVPSGGSGPAFQEVPDDPSGRVPPNRLAASSATPSSTSPSSPPTTAAPSTTSTTAPSSGGFQDVPDDSSGGATPGKALTGRTISSSSSPDSSLGDGTYLAPSETSADGSKVFRLTMAPTTIETEPGVTKQAYAFNGIVPGPTLRVNEGDKVRIIVDNNLPFATAAHWHGMILPNDQDGVPGITQPAIEPGQRHTYEFTAVATGTHWYHSHSSGRHIGKGLYGALEVVPKLGDFRADRDYTIMIGDTDLGFVFNGKSFPATTPLLTKVGETVRLRVINTGDQAHAFHVHGVPFDVVAQDGNRIAVPSKQDTLTIVPGQTFDLLVKQEHPGKWLVHCHMFAHSHVASDTMHHGSSGMTGMVTYLDVAPKGAALPGVPLATTAIGAHPDHATGSDPTWWPGLQDQLALVVLAVLLTVALRTGHRRRFLLPLTSRKDHTQ
jgi:plastocyanin/heme/copper-type cytochrome/quinol oxidase subunit 2